MNKEAHEVRTVPIPNLILVKKKRPRTRITPATVYKPTLNKGNHFKCQSNSSFSNLNQALSMQNESLQNLIPEVGKMLNPQLNIYKRLFWTISVLLCAVVCVYQFQNRLLDYLQNPVMTDISVTHAQTVNFPGVTICPSKPVALRSVSDHMELLMKNVSTNRETLLNMKFDYFNTTLEAVWNDYALSDDAVTVSIPCIASKDTAECDGKEMAKFDVHIDYVQTLLGNCTVLTPIHALEYQGPNTFLYFEVNPPMRYHETNTLLTDIQIFIHSPGIHHIHDAVFLAEYLYKNYRTKIRFEISEFVHLNRSDKACSSELTNTKCRNKCVERMLHKYPGIKCRLPFMTRLDASKLEDCQTVYDAVISYENARKFYADLKTEDCFCGVNCVDVVYRVAVDVEGNTNGTQTEFILYYADNVKIIMSETYAYRFTAFVSDVGGSLGFFLGISFLSILEIVEKILETFLKIIFCKPPATH